MTEQSSDLKATLQRDLQTSIREQDKIRSGTLRMALTAVANEEVAGATQRQLSDDEVLAVLTKEGKRRREASNAYVAAGRAELAAQEDAELVILQAYLPAQLEDAELEAMAADAVAETGASGMAQMGQVMKALQPKVAGRADGGRVAAAVKRALG